MQHGTAADYPDGAQRPKMSKSKSSYHKKMSTSSHNTLLSKSSTGSSDTEPFYLHPPSIRPEEVYNQPRTPPDLYGSIPNDGLYINPMRTGILTPPSPNGSVSGESFYLHDPQEVIYNRVKDIFDSDTGSQKEGSNGMLPNAMTVQVEVHSSSSGAGSGSEESLSVSSTSEEVPKPNNRAQISNGNNNNNNNNNNIANNVLPGMLNNSSPPEHHDYEDIYLVREEARNNTKPKYSTGRSRSRDSGSHSRSASASSSHSTDIVVHYGGHVS